jgi:hypothetical protein
MHLRRYWPTAELSLDFAGDGEGSRAPRHGAAFNRNTKRGHVYKSRVLLAACAALGVIIIGIQSAARADDDFPFVGKYTQNVACKGDGTDAEVTKVTITPQEIVSSVGVCTILDKKKDGDSTLLHVECKFPAGPLMGDITFTQRPDHTIEFVDRDMTYKAILHRCPN